MMDKKCFTYNDYNNRVTMAVTGVSTTSYSYDKNNRLLTENKATGNVTAITRYFYDPNENQIYKSTETVKPKTAGEEKTVVVSLIGENAENSDVIEDRMLMYT
jgi:hypothetical protein